MHSPLEGKLNVVHTSSPPPITTPLRLKQKSTSPTSYPLLPTAVARRQSNSYRQLRQNNLVSNSPFKSHTNPSSPPSTSTTNTSSHALGSAYTRVFSPNTPAFITRRVSGEKRPRPNSMHEQAEVENDRPFAYKRERRQSKGFKNLLEQEPVTRSPFRKEEDIDAPESRTSDVTNLVSPSAIPAVSPSAVSAPSPTRSSLVSRRLLGPRTSNSSANGIPLTRRRSRRKTVTFDERCDVLEFEPEDDEDNDSNVFESDGDFESETELEEQIQKDLGPDVPSPPQESRKRDEHLVRDSDALSGLDAAAVSHDQSFELQLASHAKQNESASPLPSIVFEVNEPSISRTHPFVDDADPFEALQASLGLGFAVGAGLGLSPTGKTWKANINEHGGNTSCEDVDVPALLDKTSKPVAASATASASALLDKTSKPVVMPAPTSAPSSPKSPPTSTRSPLIPNARVTSRVGSPLRVGMSSPRARSVSTSGDIPSPGTQVTVSPKTGDTSVIPGLNGRKVGSPPTGLRVRPRIDRDRLRRRLMKERGPMNHEDAVVGSEGEVEVELVGEDSMCTDPGEHEKELSGERLSTLSLSPSFVAESATATIEHAHKVVVATPPASSPASATAIVTTPNRGLTLRREDNMTHDGVLELDPEPSTIDPPRPTVPIRAATESGIDAARTRTGVTTEHADVGKPRVDFGRDMMFDFGSKLKLSFGHGLGNDIEGVGDEAEARGVELGDVRSALDRLMDDVAGTNARDKGRRRVNADDSRATVSLETSFASISRSPSPSPPLSPIEPAAHTRVETEQQERRKITDVTASGETEPELDIAGFTSAFPPPPPPKSSAQSQDARRERERLILEKRRLARRIEEEEAEGRTLQPPKLDVRIGGLGARPARRRSRSTGDVPLVRPGDATDAVAEFGGEGGLEETIEKELMRKFGAGAKSKYHVREREQTIYASSSHDDMNLAPGEESVGHVGSAGDVDTGKAWRMVRRPSDMNEHSKQIKQMPTQDKRAHGKVFVKVLRMKGLELPMPQQTTAVTCTLNNGIHYVTTPECWLTPNSNIDQEFELIEHSKLEFTLTMKVRRDTHIISQFKALSVQPTVAAAPVPASKGGGMRSLFSSSPRRSAKDKAARASPTLAVRSLPENLARYLKPDGTLARAFIAFKDVAAHCDTRLFETTVPLIGQKLEPTGVVKTLEVGELVLQMFRLPPLPGISADKLPQSLEECQRGLRHVSWHKVTYFESVLTQNGGDCMTWRRRHFRVIGASMVAFNDVTRKATATIDLKKALAVHDDQEARPSSTTLNSADEYDGLSGVERSFRLMFLHGQEILFFADSDSDKAKWLEVLRALIGNIPPNPLWAEIVWQRQNELAAKAKVSGESKTQQR